MSKVPEGFSTIDVFEHLHCLFVGPSHSGKTILGGTFPGPVAIIDADNGHKSLMANPMTRDRVSSGDIFWRVIEPTIGIVNNMKAIEEALADVGKLVLARKVRTVLIDSATTIMDNTTRSAMAMLNKTWNDRSYGVWESSKAWLMDSINKLFKLPCHVIVSAHETMERDDLTGQIFITPMVIGNLREKLPIYFDEVWRTYVERNDDTGKREYWVDPSAGDQVLGAGSRLHLEDCFKPNSFESAMELYREKGGIGADAMSAPYEQDDD